MCQPSPAHFGLQLIGILANRFTYKFALVRPIGIYLLSDAFIVTD